MLMVVRFLLLLLFCVCCLFCLFVVCFVFVLLLFCGGCFEFKLPRKIAVLVCSLTMKSRKKSARKVLCTFILPHVSALLMTSCPGC